MKREPRLRRDTGTETYDFLLPDRVASPGQVNPSGASHLRLDPERLALIEADTARAAELLSEIFCSKPSSAALKPPAVRSLASDVGARIPITGGLAPAHGRVLCGLATRRSWTTAKVTALCGQHGLRLAGALDVLNETAYDLCGVPLLEPTENRDGSQALVINHDVLQEMLQ